MPALVSVRDLLYEVETAFGQIQVYGDERRAGETRDLCSARRVVGRRDRVTRFGQVFLHEVERRRVAVDDERRARRVGSGRLFFVV